MPYEHAFEDYVMRPISCIRRMCYTGRMPTTTKTYGLRKGVRTNGLGAWRSDYSGTRPGDRRKDYGMTESSNLPMALRRESADWYADMRLRSVLLHWPTLDLMRETNGLPREVKPLPDRGTRRRAKAVRHGYIVGSPAERASRAMGLAPIGGASRPFGDVRYVEGRTPTRKAAPPKVVTPTPRKDVSGGGVVTLTDHDMMARLGILPVGFLE